MGAPGALTGITDANAYVRRSGGCCRFLRPACLYPFSPPALPLPWSGLSPRRPREARPDQEVQGRVEEEPDGRRASASCLGTTCPRESSTRRSRASELPREGARNAACGRCRDGHPGGCSDESSVSSNDVAGPGWKGGETLTVHLVKSPESAVSKDTTLGALGVVGAELGVRCRRGGVRGDLLHGDRDGDGEGGGQRRTARRWHRASGWTPRGTARAPSDAGPPRDGGHGLGDWSTQWATGGGVAQLHPGMPELCCRNLSPSDLKASFRGSPPRLTSS